MIGLILYAFSLSYFNFDFPLSQHSPKSWVFLATCTETRKVYVNRHVIFEFRCIALLFPLRNFQAGLASSFSPFAAGSQSSLSQFELSFFLHSNIRQFVALYFFSLIISISWHCRLWFFSFLDLALTFLYFFEFVCCGDSGPCHNFVSRLLFG